MCKNKTISMSLHFPVSPCGFLISVEEYSTFFKTMDHIFERCRQNRDVWGASPTPEKVNFSGERHHWFFGFRNYFPLLNNLHIKGTPKSLQVPFIIHDASLSVNRFPHLWADWPGGTKVLRTSQANSEASSMSLTLHQGEAFTGFVLPSLSAHCWKMQRTAWSAHAPSGVGSY